MNDAFQVLPTRCWLVRFHWASSLLAITFFMSVSAFSLTPAIGPTVPTNGTLDPTFTAGVTDGDATGLVSLQLPNGQILVGGTFTRVNGTDKGFLALLNADGSLDNTFNPGGAGPNGQVYEIIRLSDGKFLIGGFFTTYNGTSKSGIARLNADGTLDTTFNSGGAGVTGGVQTINLQPDGKIVISSNFTAYNGTSRFGVARLNADGTLDTSFTSPFTASAFVEEIDVLSDGRFIIAGGFTLNGRTGVMRLNSNGTADTTFNAVGSGADQGVFALKIQADGKILIGGGFNSYNGVIRQRGARLNADGSLDTSFVPPPIQGNGTEYIDILADGRILVAGGFFDGVNRYAITRLNADGSDDPTFADVFSDATGYHVTRQTDGKILLTGFFNRINGQSRRNIVRLNTDGTVDSSFSTTLGEIARVNDIVRQPDGKIVAVGNFNFANGVPRSNIARFNVDGTLDTSFDSGIGTMPDLASASNFVNTVALQADGKILIGGTFSGYNGTLARGIARLNADGSIDPSFNAGLDDTFEYQVVNFNHILVQPDGKLMVGGNVFITSANTFQLIARLNSNGTLDSTFLNGNSTTGGSVQRILLQPDGKYVVVGNFNNISGQNKSRIARLNPDSSHDPAFNQGSGANTTISNALLQSDGKILMGGLFVTYNGTPRNRIARVNADGSLDTGFVVGSGMNASVLSFAQQGDGKILVGGSFSTYNGAAAVRLARLNTDGSIDNSFVSAFADDPRFFVRRIILQPDSKLLIAGLFTAYGATPRNSFARVMTVAAPTIRSPFDFDGDGKTDVGIFRSSAGEWWYRRSLDTQVSALTFGASTDVITPADFTGDGRTDVALFRPSTASWFILRSEDGSFYSFPFGSTGDIPMPADYDGDGKADVAVYRPSNSLWVILRSSDGQAQFTTFGTTGDQPVAADYDGDGKADVGIWRTNGTSGAGEWWIQRSTAGLLAVVFGTSTDKAVPGDYTGDGKTDVAVYRPSTSSWFVLRSDDFSFYSFPWGSSGDIPTPGDYDGDGKTDAAVFRPSAQTWYLLGSTSGAQFVGFGLATDTPVPNAYVR